MTIGFPERRSRSRKSFDGVGALVASPLFESAERLLPMPFLEARGVDKRFGAVKALENAHLDVEQGEVHVLIGSNGSGKSTLCKIIGGSVIPDAGRLHIDGRVAAIKGPRDAERAGIRVFYQELSLVPQLSVGENLFLGALPRKGPGLIDRRVLRRRAEALLELFAGVTGSGFSLDTPVQELRNDQRQMVEILKALAAEAHLIIFDEPTSSLDKRQVMVFFKRVRQLREQGRAIIFISHRMDEIFEIGDRVTVLRDGRSVACLRLADTDRDTLVEHMVGGRIAAVSGRRALVSSAGTNAAVLKVEGLNGHRLTDIAFELQRGEILGFGGLHGQGQSRVLRILFGAETADSGRIQTAAVGRHPSRPVEAIHQGMAYISGDRGRDGVLLTRPILENLVAADLTKHRRIVLSPAGLARLVMPVVKRLKMRFPGFGHPIASLSGGNQQKAVIGRWLAIQPTVMLLDDPTKGIDLQSKADLYQIMRELAAEGVSIILYSSEDAELLGIADRILVFNGGRIVKALTGEQLTAFNLYQAAYEVRS
jgi:ribose transport system ATP-binding protein